MILLVRRRQSSSVQAPRGFWVQPSPQVHAAYVRTSRPIWAFTSPRRVAVALAFLVAVAQVVVAPLITTMADGVLEQL